ncbi:MAG: BrnA antitoxin family protein [Clostridia bacterium]|nr:BrnA antitoxin family protein [Clostridia bacterium]
MIVHSELKPGDKLTEEQIKMLEEAAKREPVYDPENPPLSEEEIIRMREAARRKRAAQNKQTVSLRLSPQTLEKAKALGPGYTTILAEIIEEALNGKDAAG